jgi:predicted deacylase
MKRSILVAAIALTACGKSPAPTNATYFVPRAAMAGLADEGLTVVGTHDSGLIVQPSAGTDISKLAALPDAFRFDDGQKEFTLTNFSSMERKLKDLAAQHPALAKLDTYGTSQGGHPEYVLTVGKNDPNDPKPELMITGATHGNETATVDVVLGLAETLLTQYGKDPRITAMVDGHTIHFIPAVCVDSYIAQTRENEGVDPNRAYDYPGHTGRNPPHAIKDIIAYFSAHDIVGSMDIHDAASMVMFPWAYTYDHIPQPDYDKMDDLTTRMARENGFAHGDIADTIYIAVGSSADYYYWKKKTVATAIELSHNLALTRAGFDSNLEESLEMTWTFIENF